MNIALVEPVMTGHRPTYLKYYIKACLKKGHHVFVFCPDDSVIHAQNFDLSKGELHFIDFKVEKKKCKRFSTTRNALLQWKNLSKKLKQISVPPDLVFFMGLDTFHAYFFNDLKLYNIQIFKYLNKTISYYIDWKINKKWAGIFLGADHSYPAIFFSKNNIGIGVLEETFRFDQEQLDKKLIDIPDITDVELKEEVSKTEQKLLQKAQGRKIISLLGRVHKRKSVITFLDAADELRSENLFFFIAGEPVMDSFNEQEKNRLMKRQGKNYFIYPERINDGHEFNSLLRSSSVVFASYKNFNYSSNMLTKCAFFEKPMIVTEETYMADIINKYNMGLTIRERSVEDTVQAVRGLADSFNFSEAKFQKYYELNRVDRIDEVIEILIQGYSEQQNS